jgi:uncharacterized protein (TIGR02145 family)
MNVAKLFLCLAITSFIACTTEVISERDPYPSGNSGGEDDPSSSSDNSNPSSSSSNGQTYKTVKIGEQVWMAEDLNYNIDGSMCKQGNCDKYGRLYDWATAMALPSGCNSTTCSGQIQQKHKGICPSGWHIPDDLEWDALMTAVGGQETAGKHLKANNYEWYSCGPSGGSFSCLDTYGFSALPGYRRLYSPNTTSYNQYPNVGYWWSTSEHDSSYANCHGMTHHEDYAYWYYDCDKSLFLLSVRCIEDD